MKNDFIVLKFECSHLAPIGPKILKSHTVTNGAGESQKHKTAITWQIMDIPAQYNTMSPITTLSQAYKNPQSGSGSNTGTAICWRRDQSQLTRWLGSGSSSGGCWLDKLHVLMWHIHCDVSVFNHQVAAPRWGPQYKHCFSLQEHCFPTAIICKTCRWKSLPLNWLHGMFTIASITTTITSDEDFLRQRK